MLWDDAVDLGNWFEATEYDEDMFIDDQCNAIDQRTRSTGSVLQASRRGIFEKSDR